MGGGREEEAHGKIPHFFRAADFDISVFNTCGPAAKLAGEVEMHFLHFLVWGNYR